MRSVTTWVLALLLCACSATEIQAPEGQVVSIVWPPAPQQTRIEYLRQFDSPDDLGIGKSLGRRLRGWLAGAQESKISRPYSITSDPDRIIVADPGSATVHVFNTQRNSYHSVTRAGKQGFRSPIGVALGGGRLYVADSVLNKVFILDQRFKLQGTIETFERPTGLAFDAQGQRLYVADTLAHEIGVFTADGQRLFTIGKRGKADGQFNFPSHLAVSANRLIVNDTMNFRIQVFDLEGYHLSTFGEHGNVAGFFSQSKGVALDREGHVYVADAPANRVQIFDQNGEFLLTFGSAGTAPGTFNIPAGITIQGDTIYVADSFNQRIQVFRYHPEEP